MRPADRLEYTLMLLARCRRLALTALGDVLTDDRTTAVRLADMEAALDEIARISDTTPLPSPLTERLRQAMKDEAANSQP